MVVKNEPLKQETKEE